MDLPITNIVLAGGRGKRLGGADKGLIRNRDGVTLLEKLLRGFSDCARESLLVIREEQADQYRNIVESFSLELPVRLIFDAGLGPAAALVLAAEFSAYECMLVTGADHPCFDPELVKQLVKVWQAEESEVIAARRESQESDSSKYSFHPLWAMYRRSSVRSAASKKDWSHRSLNELLRDLGPSPIESDSEALISINYPSDMNSFDCEMPYVDSH